MIVVRKDFIASRHNVYYPASAVVKKTTCDEVTIVVNAAWDTVQAFDALIEESQQWLSQYTTAKPTVKEFEPCFKNWAEFRRNHRHALIAKVTDNQGLTFIDVDNLYPSRKTLSQKSLVWSYGVESFDLDQLHDWIAPEPKNWEQQTWKALMAEALY